MPLAFDKYPYTPSECLQRYQGIDAFYLLKRVLQKKKQEELS